MKAKKKSTPTLDRLMKEGHVWLDKDDIYVGRAADGVEVSLGYTHWVEQVEKYLASNPSPEQW